MDLRSLKYFVSVYQQRTSLVPQQSVLIAQPSHLRLRNLRKLTSNIIQ
jgi:hypothetical protein